MAEWVKTLLYKQEDLGSDPQHSGKRQTQGHESEPSILEGSDRQIPGLHIYIQTPTHIHTFIHTYIHV